MMMKISPDQARALTLLVQAIRPDWDPQGVYAAIRKARDLGDLAEVCAAAIAAARSHSNRTPAIIAMQGPHWTGPRHAALVETECPIHERIRPAHNCRSCRSEWLTTGTWPEGTLHTQAHLTEASS